MERKNSFLTFLTALIPGVGYMYLGLMRKGVEALLIFLVLRRFFDIMSLSAIGWLLSVVLWFYCFIDTFNVAHRINMGEFVPDSDFILGKIINNFNNNNDQHYYNNSNNGQFNNQNNGQNNGQYNNQYYNQNNQSYNSTYTNVPNPNSSRNLGIAIGVFLVVVGVFAIFNQIFINTDLYQVVKNYLYMYFLPVLIIGLGVYLLLKSSNKNKK